MARQPILPSSLADPTGQNSRELRAMADFKQRMLKIQRGMMAILGQQQYTVVTLNAAELALNETVYRFELDENILDRINAEIGILIDAILLQGGQRSLWFMDLYVQPAYQQGTAQSVANLSVQSAEYALSRPTLESVLLSDPYRKRIGLVRAREFENMQNLTAWMKNDLSRTLSQGMSLGQNPRVIAKSIKERIGGSQSRAETIARTEITNALRQARMDETLSAQESLGIQTKEMHLSALSPTTRPTHAARHSKLFSIQEQKEWWARDANSINCYLPGTRVAGRFVAGSKAHYAGPVVKLVTASGRNLTVTPNHPVMTNGGLVAAAKIKKGDNLLAYGIDVVNPIWVPALNDKQGHSAIEDVFASLLEVGHSGSARVGAVDFHGDGEFINHDVSVVFSDSVLPVACDASISKALDCLSLKHADPALGKTGSSFLKSLFAICLPSSLIVSRPYAILSKLWSKAFCANYCGFGHPTEGKPVLSKKPVYGYSGYPSGIANLQNGLTGVVSILKLAYVKYFVEPLSFWNTSLSKPSEHGAFAYRKSTSNACGALPGNVSVDNVVDVIWLEYFGHVYDLEEVSGLMIAENLISSNCKCSTVSVLVDEDGTPLTPSIIERAKAMRR